MIIRHKIWYIYLYIFTWKLICYIFDSLILRSRIVYRILNLAAAQTRPWVLQLTRGSQFKLDHQPRVDVERAHCSSPSRTSGPSPQRKLGRVGWSPAGPRPPDRGDQEGLWTGERSTRASKLCPHHEGAGNFSQKRKHERVGWRPDGPTPPLCCYPEGLTGGEGTFGPATLRLGHGGLGLIHQATIRLWLGRTKGLVNRVCTRQTRR